MSGGQRGPVPSRQPRVARARLPRELRRRPRLLALGAGSDTRRCAPRTGESPRCDVAADPCRRSCAPGKQRPRAARPSHGDERLPDHGGPGRASDRPPPHPLRSYLDPPHGGSRRPVGHDPGGAPFPPRASPGRSDAGLRVRRVGDGQRIRARRECGRLQRGRARGRPAPLGRPGLGRWPPRALLGGASSTPRAGRPRCSFDRGRRHPVLEGRRDRGRGHHRHRSLPGVGPWRQRGGARELALRLDAPRQDPPLHGAAPPRRVQSLRQRAPPPGVGGRGDDEPRDGGSPHRARAVASRARRAWAPVRRTVRAHGEAGVHPAGRGPPLCRPPPARGPGAARGFPRALTGGDRRRGRPHPGATVPAPTWPRTLGRLLRRLSASTTWRRSRCSRT